MRTLPSSPKNRYSNHAPRQPTALSAYPDIDRQRSSAYSPTAFGVKLATAETGIVQNLRMAGQQYDIATGLHYNHNRFYNPKLGRYMEPDPIKLEGGNNPYAYVGNDPVNNVDPTGLSTEYSGMNFNLNLGMYLPALPQPVVDFSAGFGDTLSFGLTRGLREVSGIGSVDYNSRAYTVGDYSGGC